ncbi:MAG: type II toxin-antitoxin system Phd/YefM family antitoxin [Geobacteraceae bacterium]
MKEMPSTKAQNNFGSLLTDTETGPVIITRNGHQVAVVISFRDFQKFTELDDRYWVRLAMEAIEEGYLSDDETEDWLVERFGERGKELIDIEITKSAYRFINSITNKGVKDILRSFVFISVVSCDRVVDKFSIRDVGKYRIVFEHIDGSPSIIYIGKRYHTYK